MSIYHIIFISSNFTSNIRPEEETEYGNIMDNDDNSSAIDDCQSQQVIAEQTKQTNDESRNIENENDCDAVKQDDHNNQNISILKPSDEEPKTTENDTCCEKKFNNLGLNESSQHQPSSSQIVLILSQLDNRINLPHMVNQPLRHETSSLKLNQTWK